MTHPPGIALLLAQAASKNSQTNQVLIWVGVLIVIGILGGVLMMALRRKLFDKDSESAAAGSLLDQLRAMHKRGELSQAEFDTAKRALSERISKAMDERRAAAAQKPRPDRIPPVPRPRTPPNPRRGVSDSPTMPPVPPGYDLTGDPLPKPHDPE